MFFKTANRGKQLIFLLTVGSFCLKIVHLIYFIVKNTIEWWQGLALKGIIHFCNKLHVIWMEKYNIIYEALIFLNNSLHTQWQRWTTLNPSSTAQPCRSYLGIQKFNLCFFPVDPASYQNRFLHQPSRIKKQYLEYRF